MVDLLYAALDILRPILFFGLLAYIPMRFGISADVAGQPSSATEVRASRADQLNKIKDTGITGLLLIPLRLLFITYLTVWLLVDKSPTFILVLFCVTLVPIYLR
jgi:hypothetical protein